MGRWLKDTLYRMIAIGNIQISLFCSKHPWSMSCTNLWDQKVNSHGPSIQKKAWRGLAVMFRVISNTFNKYYRFAPELEKFLLTFQVHIAPIIHFEYRRVIRSYMFPLPSTKSFNALK